MNELKLSHRNHYIAHVNTNAVIIPRILDDPIPFGKAACMAVNLLDDMVGETINYVFKVASDHKIDLREALSAKPEA